jgi:gamma-glutamylcyclotransferase (GGCT)/AIG2-like uncharacterized protein YtfP
MSKENDVKRGQSTKTPNFPMYYFAYGSNLNLNQMLRRCRDCKPISKGIVRDYRLQFNNVATIVPCQGQKVFGAVYTISKRDLQALDAYEGWPTLYTREWVDVETPDGIVKCLVYVMTKSREYPPGGYYFKVIEEGFDDWELPTESLYEALNRAIAIVDHRALAVR